MSEEKRNYPQLPANVWWGTRSLLQLKPTATFDEKLIATNFSVQESAARAYFKQLQVLGILDENGRATPLANKWRMDETYSDAVSEILTNTYPEGLMVACPPENLEREKALNWFMMDGLGKGSAGNKVATYALISSTTPQEPGTTQSKSSSEKKTKATKQQKSRKVASNGQETSKEVAIDVETNEITSSIPLNVNVQVHISADASPEQIDQIFAAMRKHLYDGTN